MSKGQYYQRSIFTEQSLSTVGWDNSYEAPSSYLNNENKIKRFITLEELKNLLNALKSLDYENVIETVRVRYKEYDKVLPKEFLLMVILVFINVVRVGYLDKESTSFYNDNTIELPICKVGRDKLYEASPSYINNDNNKGLLLTPMSIVNDILNEIRTCNARFGSLVYLLKKRLKAQSIISEDDMFAALTRVSYKMLTSDNVFPDIIRMFLHFPRLRQLEYDGKEVYYLLSAQFTHHQDYNVLGKNPNSNENKLNVLHSKLGFLHISGLKQQCDNYIQMTSLALSGKAIKQ
ncbi:uncharacterized protein LOC127854099 isoform X2 [Dreissena polymorpha]|uniref:Uncharacterized protein n=1 Tax=Dreissena polymorpha TaxID=45954 RepID=A0A9D4HMM3_DREPO|nr:uncharacterized protein LOC127854099 isoform X2 [Dreissena polymorpha]XP_052245056.1 uncharacterized protein LOC127854099 isoform X2 [Dreissena polymorpha]KAH3724150.1 hypothetical protein DPMN_049960 [Dreissena polymorpha]